MRRGVMKPVQSLLTGLSATGVTETRILEYPRMSLLQCADTLWYGWLHHLHAEERKGLR